MAVWAGVQCVPIAAAAAGFRLWPHHPDPPESLALAELAAVQVVAASLWFSVLFADVRVAAIAVTLLVPFDAVAGLLSSVPTGVVAWTAGFVGVWVSGLAGWAHVSRSARARPALTAVAITLTVGGALLFYTRAESAAGNGSAEPHRDRHGPLTAAIGVTLGDTPTAPAWAVVVVPLFSTIVVASIAAASRSRRLSGQD